MNRHEIQVLRAAGMSQAVVAAQTAVSVCGVLFHVVNDRRLHRWPPIFPTNKPLRAWGRVPHEPDLVDANLDRVPERGRHLELHGPCYRTRACRNASAL